MSLQKGLVGHWTFDAGATNNGTAYDSSAYDNHGSLSSSGLTVTSNSPIGDAHNFDGVDSLFQFDSITMDRFGSTLSFWVNPDSASTNYSFIGTSSDYNQMIELQQGGTNCETNSNGNRFSNSNYSLKDYWHHLAVVFDDELAYWYEDGELLSEATNYGIDNYDDDNNVEKMVADTTFNRIGDAVYDNKFAGGVSDVRIYDRSLSESEISALYNMRSQRQQNIEAYKLRPKAGDPPNLMDATKWSVGTRSSQGDFSSNGGSQDNIIIKEDTPYGDIGPVWYGYSSDPSHDSSDGGWNWYKLNDTDIDESKPYRYSVWMKQESFDGSFYHGTERVDDFNGNHNGNPYYDSNNLPSTNDWYLVVGYNQPKSFDSQTNEGGIYDINGNKVEGTTDYRWDLDGGGDSMRWHSYYYYDTTNDNRGVKFYDPRLEIIDGDHTSLTELFNAANDFSNRERKWYERFDAGVFSPRWDVTTGDISSNRQYSGDNSFGQWGGGSSVEATWTPFEGEKRISTFEYYWKEDGSQTGHGVWLYDNDGNIVQKSENENPQWYLNNGSGGRFQVAGYDGQGYNVWTKFTFDFDWQNGTFDYDMRDLDENVIRTGTTDLDYSTGVSEIRFHGAGATGDYIRFDNITVTK